MVVLGTCVNFKLLEHGSSERILGEHALYGVLYGIGGMLGEHVLVIELLESAGIARVMLYLIDNKFFLSYQRPYLNKLLIKNLLLKYLPHF